MANLHLNQFQFFSNDPGIENNLTRGLAICLKNDPAFLLLFLKSIIESNSWTKLNQAIYDDSINIDIQVDCDIFSENEISKIYAIALTTEKLNESEFFNNNASPTGKNITDIVIQFGQELILIEAKRTSENCLDQLNQQVKKVLRDEKKLTQDLCNVQSKTWGDILDLIDLVSGLNRFSGKDNIILLDYLAFVRNTYPSWLPARPFSGLKEPFDRATIMQMNLRLNQAKKLEFTEKELTSYQDRLVIDVADWDWASEISPYAYLNEETKLPEVQIYIWPANTKNQGYYLDYNDLEWTQKERITIVNKTYPLKVIRQFKFSHIMGRYITQINFEKKDLRDGLEIYTSENFIKWCGKINRSEDNWASLEKFFDFYFKKDFNWRKQCIWDENFINSNRQFLQLSFGFEAVITIDFDTLKFLDNEKDPIKLGKFLRSVKVALKENLREN